jgi:antitoxin (DNA-binding transcriptional repressor) of toxin-antitoxin stability system
MVMKVKRRTMKAAEFKAKCLRVLDDVAKTGRPVVITKRGKPVARVEAMEPPCPVDLRGAVKFLTGDEEELFSTGERWDAEDGSVE